MNSAGNAFKQLLISTGLVALFTFAVSAQESDQDLAKQLSNPISSLTTIPFQFNYDGGIGPNKDGYRITLNIQPVIPFDLDNGWSLISRTIIPVVYQDEIFPGAGSQFGLSDSVQSLFFVPPPIPLGESSALILGAGPVFLLPTGTDALLSARKWGAGPTVAGIFQSGPWTAGALANHIWSFAGDNSRPDINQTFINPFVSYRTAGNYTFTLQTEAAIDWVSDDWSAPISVGVSKLIVLSGQPLSLSLSVKHWSKTTSASPSGWAARAGITFLFPN